MAQQDGKKKFVGQQFKNNPFKELKGMKVGPLCLRCEQPITRVKGQRQGYLHDACETQAIIAPTTLLFDNGRQVEKVVMFYPDEMEFYSTGGESHFEECIPLLHPSNPLVGGDEVFERVC